MKKTLLGLALLTASISNIQAQVKIGDNPNTINVNSMLELESTNKGFLPPRMALSSLASASPLSGTVTPGMLIYSSGGTVTDGYYYWGGTKWLSISTSTTRSNYVLVKSATDFPAPSGGVITLVAGTVYEINGAITLSNKIDLNNCTVTGKDESNDKLIYTGSSELFTGSNGGTLRYLALTASAGKAFNINGGGSAIANLIIENCFFLSCTSIGTVQGMGGYVYFGDIGYYANTAGITFQNNNYVYMNNSVWDPSNTGTYETYVGAFNVIQILGGNHDASSGQTVLNITGISTLGNGTIKAAVFRGAGTYVNGTFSNSWEVEASGLNTQKDDVSSGNLYVSSSVTTTFSAVNTPTKILGTTTSTNLFRVSSPTNNRLQYTGAKTKTFLVICSMSIIFGGNNKVYSFYVTKNGVKLTESMVTVKSNATADQNVIPISCTVSLAPNDYIEIWGQNNIDNSAITVSSMNLAIK